MADYKPRVTIMIPTYNQSGFILDAVISALAQSYEHLEVIVGDDASTDDTEQLIKRVRDARLKYVKQEKNLGRTGNYRNLLYEHVSGDYVVNLDGDDYYTDTQFIADAVDQFANAEVTPIMVAARATYGKTGVSSELPPCSTIDGLQLLKQIPKQAYGLLHMTVVYSVEAARRTDFYSSPAISSDWESLYRLAASGSVAYLNRVVGVWRYHGGNATSTVDIEEALENLSIWRSIYSHATMHGMGRTLGFFKSNQCVAYFALRALVSISRQGNRMLSELLCKVAVNYPIGFVFLIVNPRSLKRLLRSFFGFDRNSRS